MPTDLVPNDEKSRRNQLDILKSPDFFLQSHHLTKFSHGVTTAKHQAAPDLFDV
jgi:hypothetical protein